MLARFAAAIAAMVVVVTASNILVQYPVDAQLGPFNLKDLLTWGAFTYPFAFLVTDLTNRYDGANRARIVVICGFVVARGLSAYLAKIVSSRPFLELREVARKISRKLPEPLHRAAKKTDEFARGMAMGGTLFEELGFYYVGPVDGHNLDHLIPVLENVRDAPKDRA